ncbi:MAG: hypothetical protein ACHP7N_10995 [Caulobacterales bacterium]
MERTAEPERLNIVAADRAAAVIRPFVWIAVVSFAAGFCGYLGLASPFAG